MAPLVLPTARGIKPALLFGELVVLTWLPVSHAGEDWRSLG